MCTKNSYISVNHLHFVIINNKAIHILCNKALIMFSILFLDQKHTRPLERSTNDIKNEIALHKATLFTFLILFSLNKIYCIDPESNSCPRS